MKLESRYQEIRKRLEELSDFSVESLTRSRKLFYLERDPIVPRRFEVWTSLIGLPLSNHLTENFQALFKRIVLDLPADKRYYQVAPQNYHWELFIIKRPNEKIDEENLQETSKIIREVICNQPSLKILYRGFLITQDGTVIVKGYGDFDQLRTQLRHKLPWASLQQSNLGHISLGRLLDPLGEKDFSKLKSLVHDSWNEFYGELEVNSVKFVHEKQWYMESKEIVEILPFGTTPA